MATMTEFYFIIFLSQSRIKNSRNVINWTIISTGCNYSRGIGKKANLQSIFHGNSATYQTMHRIIKGYDENYFKC